jgi:xanthine dehydrogenase accessory factor
MTTRAIDEHADRLRAERVPFVVARVVLAERPTSAKPGDSALVLPDGTIEGFVGGQCAVSTLRAQGLEILRSGTARLLRIAPNPEPDQPGKTVVHNPCQSGGTLEIFMEPVLPAPLVRVVGQSPIARALEAVGASLGYAVEAWNAESSKDVATVDALIIASHGEGEEEALVHALDGGVPYIGLIASPKRGGAVVESLGREDAERIHTPAGLDIGARTPEEVALSVFGQIIAERTKDVQSTSSCCGGKPAAATESVTAIDPVCKMTVAAVETSIHADVNGVRYYFCCPGCKDGFIANPDTYLQS